MATSLCSSLTARPDFIPADASSSASHDDVENCHKSVTHKQFLLSWKIFEDTHPDDHLALCTEGESVCVQERLCSGTAISRGHVIWPIDLATIPADASHVHFRYVSGLTGHTLAQSQSLPLQSVTRSTSPNVPVSQAAVEVPSTDQSAASGTLSESSADQSGVCGPFLESSSGPAADATVEKSEMVTCESPGDHHYSPLWLKTTGESIYRFDGNSEPIYETLYPVAAGTAFGETPPPLPPRNTGGGSFGNLHKPLTRSKALHYSNWSRESDNDDMEAEDSTPPPPPRSRNDSGETRVAEPLEEPPLIPARKPQAHLTPPVIPKRMNAASPELPPRGKRHGSVSPSRTTERRLVTRTAEAASRLPSIATLPLRSKYQKAELPPEEESLPAMWEARVDIHGRVFYVDHNTRTTSWVRPQQTSTSSSVSSASGLNDVSRQQLDRRYQSIRRTINRQRRREEHDSSPSPAAQQQAESSPAMDETPPANLLDSPALQFVTRPDFFALLHSNEEATQLYNRSPAVRQLLARLWRNPTSFQRYQHNRDLVSLLNLFADTSRSLPGNWETRQDKHGRTFYIDHQHKTTTYIDPRLPKLSESIQLAAAAAAAASGASSASAETSMEADDEADAGGAESAAPQTPPRAPAPPPRPPTSHSGRSSPVNPSEVPTAYNEKVVAFLRQPNVHDILRERHPELSRNTRLRDKVNGVRVDGTSALERWSHDVELTILLSLFENEIMSYVPPLLSSATVEPVAAAAALNGRSTPQLSPHSSPAPMRQVRNPVRHGKRDFETKLRHFYRKLESKGYGQGPSKFKMSIRRDHLLEDAYVKIMSASKKDLQKAKLHISFAGEDGLDYGGPSREFFFLLSREVFNPYYGLFEYSANDTYTVQISPMSAFVDNYNEWFRFCGRILGLALVHQYLLDVFFTRPFYKALLRLPVSLSDLESLDAEFHQSLLWLRDNNLNTVGTDLELSFSVMEEVGGKLEERELKPGGKNIPVTEKNKKEYLERMVRWRLDRGVTEQNEALLRGFSEVLEPRYVAIFDARELELVLAGTADIDVSDWRKNTEYRSGYHDGHQVVQWFWSAIEKFSNEQRLRLLQFVTGTSSIPYEGFAALRGSTGPRKFCIEKWGQPDSLPRAHTCFNRLDLPPYENADTLYEKLLLAVEETSTFGIE